MNKKKREVYRHNKKGEKKMKVKLMGGIDLKYNERKYYEGEELEVNEVRGFEVYYFHELGRSSIDLIPKKSCEIIERERGEENESKINRRSRFNKQ